MTVTATNRGIKLTLDENVISPDMIKKITEGKYEVAEANNIERILAEDEVVLELGAGIGFISSLTAKHPKTKRIVSYEANPKLIPIIKKTLTDNTDPSRANWEVRNAILANGTKAETMDFYVHRNFWASSLLPIENAEEVVKIPVVSFNAVLADICPTLIVCDIEGGELDLFKNADLSSVKKVYMEVHQKRIGRRGMIRLFDYMHSRGFHYDQNHSHGSVVLFSSCD
jgi:FkbM family methyltransferase